MSDKQILEWQEKVRMSYGDEAKLYQYLFETMDNFFYRYLETTIDKNLKTKNIAPHLWGAMSRETSMQEALKIQNPLVKKGMIEMAKTYPKSQNPEVRYELLADVKELTADHGSLQFISKINWGFPEFNEEGKRFEKTVNFTYTDLAEFRKHLALKLEEACEIFL